MKYYIVPLTLSRSYKIELYQQTPVYDSPGNGKQIHVFESGNKSVVYERIQHAGKLWHRVQLPGWGKRGYIQEHPFCYILWAARHDVVYGTPAHAHPIFGNIHQLDPSTKAFRHKAPYRIPVLGIAVVSTLTYNYWFAVRIKRRTGFLDPQLPLYFSRFATSFKITRKSINLKDVTDRNLAQELSQALQALENSP